MNSRRYTRANQIENIAKFYYKRTRKGITYRNLLLEGQAKHKSQAQNSLKRFRMKNILFTIENRRPQQYFPTSMKSEIIQHRMRKNAPIQPTGNSLSQSQHLIEEIINQSLVEYVLPLLPAAPLYIHNMHFKLKINPECYDALDLSTHRKNNGKHVEIVIGSHLVTFTLYRNGTTEVYISSSNNPFKLNTELDLGRLLVFIGQIKQSLIQLLSDPHERIVPDVMEWQISECDINKDIPISDAFHYTGLKIQIKHFNRLFRIYFKALGKQTVCRVEESKTPNGYVVSELAEIFLAHSEK